MRVFVQKQLIELLQTISDGVKFVDNNNKDAAENMLMDCYAAANSIENAMRSGLSAMHFAEYSDELTLLKAMLEFLYDAVLSEQSVSDVTNDINKQIKLTQNKLSVETEVKLEVVFMPYKASMWDCLETIYLSAKEDTRCDAYVVPIPYFDKNPDGTFSKKYYEGNDFPEYIDILHYENYDAAIRKPDVIYIHNPYDEYNFVTSVDPKYFSHELKKHTDMLVYVPYFYTGYKFADSHLLLSAYQHSDKIIVQNDAVVEQLSENVSNDKLIALGSPKADKTIKCCQNKKIPSEWKNIIGDKKVIMYNVSLTGLLSYNEMAIKKMICVLNAFIGRDDVVLLWRPHPLIESTLKSMRPDMWRMYEGITKHFKDNKIGIFDTTPDINESVAICDGYVGEVSSSVVSLFGITGKPIFATNMRITQNPTEDEKLIVAFNTCFVEDNDLWFVSPQQNALCRMNFSTGIVKEAVSMPIQSSMDRQYSDLIKVEDNIYLAPLNSDRICIFNGVAKTFEFIDFSEPLIKNNFIRVIKYKNYLYFIPSAYSAIVRLDLTTHELKYYTDAITALSKYNEHPNGLLFHFGVDVQDNRLFLASVNKNKVLEFNMDTEKSIIHTVGTKENGYRHMAFDGNNYWLIPFTNGLDPYIVKWNPKTEKVVTYKDFPDGFQIKVNPRVSYKKVEDIAAFISTVSCGKFTYIFPATANMILKIDTETDIISELKLDLPYTECDWKDKYYNNITNYIFAKKIDKTYIIAFSPHNHELIKIDVKTDIAEVIPCRLTPENAQKIKRPIEFEELAVGHQYGCNEMHSQRTLSDFIYYVADGNMHDIEAQKDYYTDKIYNLDGTCGEKIHEYISGCVWRKQK